jgi:predicted phage terminase large subunit-like protein
MVTKRKSKPLFPGTNAAVAPPAELPDFFEALNAHINPDVPRTAAPTPDTGEETQDPNDLLIGELLRRQRAKGSLVEYARSIDIPGAPVSEDPACEMFKPVETQMALHHRVILQAIEECIEKDFGRLMIFAPPGSAKSSYTSVVTPAWAMARKSGYRVILTSYGSDLAERMARRCRSICADPRHVSIWDDQPRLNSDQRSVSDWQLSNGSGMVAGGILSGITGNRADLLLIDDPVRGREAADSPTIQTKTMDAYRDDLLTRLKPKASVIIIQTRWNENDLSGQLLPEDYAGESGLIKCRDGQTWRVLNIPAEAEHADDPLGRKPGEFLWPEWFPEQHWLNYKLDPRGQRTWNALYQQRPTAADGIEFKREWFRWYDPDAPAGQAGHYLDPKTGHHGQRGGRPKTLIPYAASDFATKEDRAADFTEHGVAGRDTLGSLWFLDWWFMQTTSDKYIAQLTLMMDRNRPRRWAHEGGPIGNAIGPAIRDALRAAIRNKKYVCPIEEMPSVKSKAVKLTSLQAKAAAGMVYLPINRPWAERLVAQLLAFPGGRWDDAADAAGLIGRLVDKMMDAKDDRPEKREELVPFSAKWLEYSEDEERPKMRYS